MVEINQSANDLLGHIWSELTVNISQEKVAESFFAQLLLAYSQDHRHYHNCTHLHHMFGLLKNTTLKDDAVYWAAFYHDYIYHPGKSDNERKSAAVADTQLHSMGIAENVRERVTQLILATRDHHVANNDHAAALFLDADMAVLGEESVVYQNYEDNLRKEFAMIPAFLFKTGRKKFLLGLLAREKIFISDWFYARYEQQARNNIRASLTSL